MTAKRWNEPGARQVRKHRQRLHAEQQGRCYVCDRQVRAVDGEVEHDIPRSVPGAGRNEISNLRFLCSACNTARGRDNLLEFALDAVDWPRGRVSRDRLEWIIRHHRNPAYPRGLVARADAYGGGTVTAGICMMCAVRSDTVRPHKFGHNFTAYNELADGDGLCGACAGLITDRTSRQKSWIIEDGKRTIIDRSEWIPTILREKKTPFVLYLTSTGRTQGFIPLMHRPNLNNTTFVLAHDCDIIRVSSRLVPGLLSAAEYLRGRRWSKKEMTGEPVADRYADEVAIEKWEEARANPAWPVIVAGLAPLPSREDQTHDGPAAPPTPDRPAPAAVSEGPSGTADAGSKLKHHLVTMLAATWRRVDWRTMQRRDRSKADAFAACLYDASHELNLDEAINTLCRRLGVEAPCFPSDAGEYFKAYNYCTKHEGAVLGMLEKRHKLLAWLTSERAYGVAGEAGT